MEEREREGERDGEGERRVEKRGRENENEKGIERGEREREKENEKERERENENDKERKIIERELSGCQRQLHLAHSQGTPLLKEVKVHQTIKDKTNGHTGGEAGI